jgi:hypothetical protein
VNEDGKSQFRRLGFWGIATIVFVSVALNVVLLCSRLTTDDRVREASVAPGSIAAQIAESSPSPPPAKPPDAEASTRRAQDQPSGWAYESAPSPTIASQASSQRGAQSAPILPGGDSMNRPGTVAAAAASATGASGVAAQAPELHGGVAATATSSPEEPKVEPSAGSPPPDSKTPDDREPGSSDRTPPVLALLRFDPPAVEGGSVTTLTIQASDELSGVKSFSGEVRSPNGLATLPFWGQVVGGNTTFSFPLTIPREAESGIWYVSWISITDGADNALLIQAPSAARAPAGGTLTVSSSQSDSTPPEVLQIWFDRPTVEGGEKNVIRVEARDDSSGVASIMGACQSASKSALIWFTCALDSGTGSWAGDVSVPKNADCGNWGIQQLSVKDKAGNTTLLNGESPILARAGFQVAFRSDCDSTPPTLDAFDLSPTVVSSETATEISVTAMIHDAGSGAATLTGWFDGPISEGGQAPKNYIHCAPAPSDPDAPWSCKIQVPLLAARGIWKVGVLRLEDKARNFREYTAADPVVSNRVFEVQ